MEERPEKDEQQRAAELIREVSKRWDVTTKGGVIVPRKKHKAKLISVDQVEEKPVQWLFHPYIPKGKITLCAAYPGVGKTYLLCYIAACVSTGKPFFNSTPFRNDPGRVIYLTTEDGVGDTLKPRMRACGANMENIATVIDDEASLTFDSPEIEEFVKELSPDLIIFDPFQSYIGENVEMNAANKTRSVLNHIVALAEKYNIAIVLICHFNKNQKGDAITRIIGSTDIVGVCRSYLALGTVPGNKELRYMSHEKSSLAHKGLTVLFEISPEEGGIKYVDTTQYTMDDYTSMASQTKRQAPALEECKDFIMRNMPEGKRLAKEMEELLKANSFSEATYKRAKAALNIISKRIGFGKGAIWYWILPSDSQ